MNLWELHDGILDHYPFLSTSGKMSEKNGYGKLHLNPIYTLFHSCVSTNVQYHHD